MINESYSDEYNFPQYLINEQIKKVFNKTGFA